MTLIKFIFLNVVAEAIQNQQILECFPAESLLILGNSEGRDTERGRLMLLNLLIINNGWNFPMTLQLL